MCTNRCREPWAPALSPDSCDSGEKYRLDFVFLDGAGKTPVSRRAAAGLPLQSGLRRPKIASRFGMAGVDLEGAAVVSNGVLRLPLVFKQDPPIAVRIGVPRIESCRQPVMPGSLTQLALAMEREGEVVVRISEFGQYL